MRPIPIRHLPISQRFATPLSSLYSGRETAKKSETAAAGLAAQDGVRKGSNTAVQALLEDASRKLELLKIEGFSHDHADEDAMVVLTDDADVHDGTLTFAAKAGIDGATPNLAPVSRHSDSDPTQEATVGASSQVATRSALGQAMKPPAAPALVSSTQAVEPPEAPALGSSTQAIGRAMEQVALAMGRAEINTAEAAVDAIEDAAVAVLAIHSAAPTGEQRREYLYQALGALENSVLGLPLEDASGLAVSARRLVSGLADLAQLPAEEHYVLPMLTGLVANLRLVVNLRKAPKDEATLAVHRATHGVCLAALGELNAATLSVLNSLALRLDDMGNSTAGRAVVGDPGMEADLRGHPVDMGKKRMADSARLYRRQEDDGGGSTEVPPLARKEEAVQMYRQVLAGREQVLGPNHHATLTTAMNLGALLVTLEDNEANEAMGIPGMVVHEQGPEGGHPAGRAVEANEAVRGPGNAGILTPGGGPPTRRAAVAWAVGPKGGEEGALVTVGDESDPVDDSAHYGQQNVDMEASGRLSAGGPQGFSRFSVEGRDSGNGFLDGPMPSRRRPSRHSLDAGVQRSSASRGGPSRRSLDEAQQLVQRAHDSFLVQYGPEEKKTVAAKKWLEVNRRLQEESGDC